MNNKEKILKLALAILDYHTDVDSNTGLLYCLHCDIREKIIGYDFINHKPDCPVLLAEQILKDENNGMLKYLKPVVDKLRKDGAIFVPPAKDSKTPFRDALEELQSEIAKPKPSKERFCPSCGEGKVDEVKGTEPYSEDHLMCNKCDSTFNEEEDDETFIIGEPDLIGELMDKGEIKMDKPQPIEKKPMKLYELQHHVDKLIEQGYSDTPVYFDTEAKTYDCHIVPIGSINLVPKESMGEDYIILYEYQYTEKPEEPLVVHNVMSYKGKNYLKQLSLQCDPSNTDSCKFCSFDKDCPLIDMKCGDNFIWKSFDDIQITDELACMRKDIGDIYVFNIQEDQIDKLVYVENNCDMYVHTLGWRSTNKNIRLATAEEIQKYLEMNKKCK